MSTLASNGERDPFGVQTTLTAGSQTYAIHSLPKLAAAGFGQVERLPYVVRILLENLLRHVGTEFATTADVETLANWNPAATAPDAELAFMPGRVVLQDFTGVPCVVDLAAMRSAVARLGVDDPGEEAHIDARILDEFIKQALQRLRFERHPAIELAIQIFRHDMRPERAALMHRFHDLLHEAAHQHALAVGHRAKGRDEP